MPATAALKRELSNSHASGSSQRMGVTNTNTSTRTDSVAREVTIPPNPNVNAPLDRSHIAFISGSLDADVAYFSTHYAPRILVAIASKHRFILGPSRGIDTLALDFLRSHNVHATRIRIYLHQLEAPKLRNQPAMRAFEKAGGGVVVVQGRHEERDEAMTRASHYDILRYRTQEECRVLYGAKYRKRVSGTEKNELRRRRGIGLQRSAPATGIIASVAG